MPEPMLSGWIKSCRRWLSLNSPEKESPVPGCRVQKRYQYKKKLRLFPYVETGGAFWIPAMGLMEGIHGIVMIVKAEPSSGHVSGETGRRRRLNQRDEDRPGSAFLQNLGSCFLLRVPAEGR